MFFFQHLDNYIDALFFGWKIRSAEQLFLSFLRKVFLNLIYQNKNPKKGPIPYIYYLLKIIPGQIVDRNIILTDKNKITDTDKNKITDKNKNCRFSFDFPFGLKINKYEKVIYYEKQILFILF